MPIRVVFDCMLFLQAITNPVGPAFNCFRLAESGAVTFFLSPSILSEIEDVLNRPVLRSKFPVLTPSRVEIFLNKFKAVAQLSPDPPNVFLLPRDPKDQPYTDLAIAIDVSFLVTWNRRHLIYLMDRDSPEGVEFCERFPKIMIASPVDCLIAMRTKTLSP